MTSQDDFYITGGTLPLDANSYIVRQADTQLLDCLRRGEFCYVLNTRQMGKSSLMVRTARRLKSEGYRVAVLDLSGVGQNLSAEQWYFGLLLRTATQVGQTPELTAFWKNNRELGPMQRFQEAIHQVLLTPTDAGQKVTDLVIFVDEIDAVLSLPFSADEFFAGIRECYNRRSQEETFRQLTFCLLGVAAPTDLVRDPRISPFNIGQRIELLDFTPDEAEPLAQGLRRDTPSNPDTDAKRLLRRILHWTGGHPYMTQRLCHATATERVSATDVPWWNRIGASPVDKTCRNLFLTDAAQETDDNLTFVRNRLLRNDTDTVPLLDLYLRIRRGEAVRDDTTNPLCSLLRLAGIVAPEKGWLRVRNRIYASVFDPAWVHSNLPGEEARRLQRAYQQGIWRAATAGGVGVLVFATLAAVALDRSAAAHRASQEARKQEGIARTRLSHIYVDTGVRMMDAGDYSGALAPLTEAMMLDRDTPARLALHRRRLAYLLALTPHLDNLWSSDKPIRWASYSPDRRWVATAGEDGWAHVYEAATGAELPLQMRHDGPVLYAAFSPDGNRLVTCGSDARAFIWDLNARQLVYTLHPPTRVGQSHEVTYASWSQDGKQVALSCGDAISIWRMGTNTSPRLTMKDIAAQAIYRETAFAPNRLHLVSIAENFSSAYITLPEGKSYFTISSPTLGINYTGYQAAFSKDGHRLLIAGCFGATGDNPGACVFDMTQHGKQLIPLLRHESPASDAAFSPDEQQIATASEDGTARVWDARTGKPITPPLRHEGPVNHIEFSPDGKRVVTASGDGTTRVWNAQSGEPICAPIHHAGAVITGQFGKDGNHILTASRDGTARLWTLPHPDSLSQVINQSSPATVYTSISADGKCLVTDVGDIQNRMDRQYSIRTYDLTSRDFPLPLRTKAIGFASFNSVVKDSSDKPLLLHGGGLIRKGESEKDSVYSPIRNVQVWDPMRNKPLSPLFQADWAAINGARTLILLGERSGKFRMVHAVTGKLVFPEINFSLGKVFSKHFQPFTPNDHAVLVSDSPRSVRLLDPQTGHPLTPPMKHGGTVCQWAFSPEGRYLFTWTDTLQLQVWNVMDGTPASDPIPAGDKFLIEFSPDGREAMTTTGECTWNWRLDGASSLHPQRLGIPNAYFVFSPNGKMVATLDQADWLRSADTFSSLLASFEDSAKITDAAFSPDNSRVCIVRDDGTAVVWDIHSARPATPPLLQKKITHCWFSKDGQMIATGGSDGISRVWDANTGEPITPPLQMRGGIQQVVLSPDNRRLITAGYEEGRIWNLPDTAETLEQMQARAQLLSGQRIDPTIGSVPIDAATIRSAWKRLSSSN